MLTLREQAIRYLLGALVVLFFILQAADITPLTFVKRVDNFIYDMRLLSTMPRTLDDRIVILDIDEKSLREQGQWPWGRDKLAKLVDLLFDKYQVAITGFDVVFAEADEKSGLTTLDNLARTVLKEDSRFQESFARVRNDLDFDVRFASALKNRPVVLGFVLTNDDEKITQGQLPKPVLDGNAIKRQKIPHVAWNSYTGNLPILMDAAPIGGSFNAYLEEDSGGVIRGTPLISEFGGQFYESLSLAMIRLLIGSPPLEVEFAGSAGMPSFFSGNSTGIDNLKLNLADGRIMRIPTSRHIMGMIPIRGPGGPKGGSFRYISLTDVLQARTDITALKGKIVLIGTTAPGLKDLRSTPIGADYPGVELHANLISGMLDGRVIQRPDYGIGYEVLLVLILGGLLVFLLPRYGPLGAVMLALISLILLLGLDFSLYQSAHLAMPLAGPLLLVVSLFVLDMAYGYFIETRSKRNMIDKFGEYVAPELVEEMARDPEAYNMEGEDREMSVMFCDVRGFTTISESLKPQVLREYINQYLTEMTVIIRTQYRGTLDKYIGDAIMAFWGAPIHDPEHAEQAVEAALAMQKASLDLSQRFRERGLPELRIGIGVNSGQMRVGDMGSEIRRAYTVMGDSVNLASRLEGITKTYGVGIAVGEATRKAAPGFVYRELDRVKAKGKNEAVSIYEPIGHEGEVPSELLEEIKLWHQTLKLYRAREWDRAEIQLLNLQNKRPEATLYAFYLQQITWWRQNPPPENWDGVTTFDTK